MTEVWLRPNRRVLGMAMAPAALLMLLGAGIALAAASAPARVVGLVAGVGGGLLIAGLLAQLRRPRIAYRDGEVLFFLRAGQPIAVPRDVVEAFFLGQGPAHLPVQKAEAVNLIARLSQKHPEWSHIGVKRALGQWCDSYVTIRGAWCEPLTGDVIRRLNKRLRELQLEAARPAAAGP